MPRADEEIPAMLFNYPAPDASFDHHEFSMTVSKDVEFR
jgi:hypothetical protein